jgi:rRNA-processing protein FCF1
MSNPIEIAVDTNVLLDLANDDETVIDCFNTIRQRIPNAQTVVLPTVIQELADLADSGETARKRELALKALQSIRGRWAFSPVNCIPVGHGIVFLSVNAQCPA